jgi:hypothetical protein
MKPVQRVAPPRHEMLALVRHATLAPSGHNTQPWRFNLVDGSIEILADSARRLPVVDPDDHALYISLGAALENLTIAARQSGLDSSTEYFPVSAADRLVVHLTRMSRPDGNELFAAIPERQSTRCAYDGRAIPPDDLRRLEAASAQEGVQFRLIEARHEMEAVTQFVMEGNRRQMADPAFVEELMAWVRFSRREAVEHSDGLTASAMGMPATPRWLGSRIMRALLRPEAQAAQAEKLIRSSSALMLFIAERHDREHWVKLGRSFQRVALAATLRDIRQAHMNMPCEVPELRDRLRQHLGLADAQPLLLLRIGYGERMPRSPRRSVDAVIV